MTDTDKQLKQAINDALNESAEQLDDVTVAALNQRRRQALTATREIVVKPSVQYKTWLSVAAAALFTVTLIFVSKPPVETGEETIANQPITVKSSALEIMVEVDPQLLETMEMLSVLGEEADI